MADNVLTANANSAALFQIILDGACDVIPCRYKNRVSAWEEFMKDVENYRASSHNLNTQLNDENKKLKAEKQMLEKNLKATQDHINYNLLLAGQQFAALKQTVDEKVNALEDGISRLLVVAAEMKEVLDTALEKVENIPQVCSAMNEVHEGEF